jgi:hypothetical protein
MWPHVHAALQDTLRSESGQGLTQLMLLLAPVIILVALLAMTVVLANPPAR